MNIKFSALITLAISIFVGIHCGGSCDFYRDGNTEAAESDEVSWVWLQDSYIRL